MKTLVLSENFLPEYGGTITWLVQTYSRYNPEEVIFLTSECAGSQEVDHALPFRVNRVPMKMSDWDPSLPTSFWRYRHVLSYVSESCRRNNIQQIHCAKVLPEGLVAWGTKCLTAVPYLVYAHGEEILIGLSSRKLSWLFPKIYNNASAIIANGHYTKNLLESVGVQSDRIQIIHPGVDTEPFVIHEAEIRAIKEFHNLGQSPVLLTVGRLQLRKGHDMVIKALPRMLTGIPQLKYLIVGTGEEYEYLRRLATDVDVQNSVVFAGQVPKNDLAAYYACCDVFVMPNRTVNADTEGFGIVFLEAGAAGKPVIGGKDGGTQDSISDGMTGFCVDGTNLEEIAAACVALLSNPTKAQAMGKNGRRRVEADFTWEKVLERTRNLAEAVHAQGTAVSGKHFHV